MKLIIEDDEGRKTVVPFIRDEISIGRLEGNTIRLTERNVSRHHARLLRESEAIFIEDLKSSNGVLVNGERIDSRFAVCDGDLIEIGDYDLAVEGAPVRKITDATQPNATMPFPLGEHAPGEEPLLPTYVPQPAVGPARRPIPENEAPRLVGLAGPFFGQDIRVPKAVTIIGRSDDGNDIAIDDASISRRHARLQLENGTWRIYDLNSANGVEVNQQRQSVAPVRPGDIVEIGHVKFRFTAPGEVYAPPPASPLGATTEQMPRVKSSRLPLFAGIAVAIAVLGVLGALVLARLARTKAADVPQEDLCQKGQAASAARNWPEAIKDLTVAQQLGQGCTFPVDIAIDQARKNQSTQEALAQADKLTAAGKFHQAMVILQAVPPDSIYAPDARLKMVETSAQGVKQLSDQARYDIDHDRLDEAAGLIDDLKQLEPIAASIPLLEKDLAEHKHVHETHLVASASRSAAAAAVPAPETPVDIQDSPPPSAPAVRTQEDRNAAATADIAEGVHKVQSGDLSGGIAKLQAAIAESPDASLLARAHRNIGVAYAQAKRMNDAIPHLKIFLKLEPDTPERPRVEQIIETWEGRKGN